MNNYKLSADNYAGHYRTLEEPYSMPQKPSSFLLLSVALLWLGCAVFGLASLSRRDGAAGASGHPPARWQKNSCVSLSSVKPTLVVLIHPQCPCSRASLSELNHLMALCPNRAAVWVFFLKPPGCTEAWVKTDLWRQASAIPGVRVRVDDNGQAARRFGAATSGEALLYAPDEKLLYLGGLTGARGHEGDNAGLSAVAALLERPETWNKAQPAQEPVYGCPLNRGPLNRGPLNRGPQLACRTKIPNRGGASCLP